MGITFANFQSLGISPVLRECLKMSTRYFAIHSAYLFKNSLGILSGPELFLVLRLSKSDKTPCSVTTTSPKAARAGQGTKEGILPLSVVNTERKYSLNVFARLAYHLKVILGMT